MYKRPLRSDELMHYGVPGMKWGVRKKVRQIRGLQRSSARKMKKVMRLKWAMQQQMKYRKDTAKLYEKSQIKRAKGQIARSKFYETLAKVTNPVRTIASKRVDHLDKQIANNMTKISKLSLEASEIYRQKGEEYLINMEDKINVRKGFKT